MKQCSSCGGFCGKFCQRRNVDDKALAKQEPVSVKRYCSQSEQEIDVWPFPPATGAVPWTKQQEKAYEQQKQEQLPAAPF